MPTAMRIIKDKTVLPTATTFSVVKTTKFPAVSVALLENKRVSTVPD